MTAWEVLHEIWWVGVVAMGVSLVFTPIMRSIAYRTGIVDRPDDLLKPHGRPVAYLGGLAMCLGLLVGLACYAVMMPHFQENWQALRQAFANWEPTTLPDNPLWKLICIAAACVVITITGLVDDLRDITPRQKIFGQVLAAAIILLGGVGAGMIKMILHPIGIDLPLWLELPLRSAFCVILVICTCNATNLLDGLDGLCGGVTGIISLGFLALAVWLAVFSNYPGIDDLRVGLCLAMAGAVLGFLPYNIPPASIFMGDAGSMLLGFFVATMMALFCIEGTARWFIAACIVYALPILDTALAVVRRILEGKKIFAGDRSHLYDQLVDRGMTVKQVVGLFYVLSLVAALVGVLVAIYFRLRYTLILCAVLLMIIWSIFYKLKMVTPPPCEGKPPACGDKDKKE